MHRDYFWRLLFAVCTLLGGEKDATSSYAVVDVQSDVKTTRNWLIVVS